MISMVSLHKNQMFLILSKLTHSSFLFLPLVTSYGHTGYQGSTVLVGRHENASRSYVFALECSFKQTCLRGQLIPCAQVVFWYQKVGCETFLQQFGGKVNKACFCSGPRYWLHAYIFGSQFICRNYATYLCLMIILFSVVLSSK